MTCTNLSELTLRLQKMNQESKSIEEKEELVKKHLPLLNLSAGDTPEKLPALCPELVIDITKLGELGRILELLPELQRNKTVRTYGISDYLVQRACELALALLSHTEEDMRSIFIMQFCPALTLCSDIKYFLQFLELLKQDERFTFCLASNDVIKERFKEFKTEDLSRIAANFAAVKLLPKDIKSSYIDKFVKLVPNVDLRWARQGEEAPPAVLSSMTSADALIDILAIMPNNSQLAFAKKIIMNTGSLCDYKAPNLATLEKILAYLDVNDQENFVQYFKQNCPLFKEDVVAANNHNNPRISKIFLDKKYPHFFEIKNTSSLETFNLGVPDPKNHQQESLDIYMKDCEKALSIQMPEFSKEIEITAREIVCRPIDSLKFCESILYPIQEKVQHKKRWPYTGSLSWLAERSAFLFVTELSYQEESHKLAFAIAHMKNVVWTDMFYLMKAIELLPQKDRMEFIRQSCELPDKELDECKTLWSIVGVIEANTLLDPKDHREFLTFITSKIPNIDWNEVATGSYALIAPKSKYLVGALFLMPKENRISFAKRLLTEVKTYKDGPPAKISPKCIHNILKALDGCWKNEDEKIAFVEEFIRASLCTLEQERAIRESIQPMPLALVARAPEQALSPAPAPAPAPEPALEQKPAPEQALERTSANSMFQKNNTCLWKKIIGNLLLAILGIGILYLIAIVVNKISTGNFLFFQQDEASATRALVP